MSTPSGLPASGPVKVRRKAVQQCDREQGTGRAPQTPQQGSGVKLIDHNPACRFKPLPETRGRTRFLTVEEARRLLKTLDHLGRREGP
jgi:hypothetical protein